eukprot:COSAG06_NODE_17701_length_926_cov_0.738815_1_plen_31_part_10
MSQHCFLHAMRLYREARSGSVLLTLARAIEC